jgi:hypothetical protein
MSHVRRNLRHATDDEGRIWVFSLKFTADVQSKFCTNEASYEQELLCADADQCQGLLVGIVSCFLEIHSERLRRVYVDSF